MEKLGLTPVWMVKTTLATLHSEKRSARGVLPEPDRAPARSVRR